MNVKSLANTNFIFAIETATALDIVRIMENESVGSVIIVDKKSRTKPVGIITDRDIVLKASIKNSNLEKIFASDLMSGDLLKVKDSDLVEDVIDQMCDKKVRRAPVVNAEGDLIAVISLDDIIKNSAALLNKIGLLIGRQV